MSDVAIQVRGLSKQYTLGTTRRIGRTMGETLGTWAKRTFGRAPAAAAPGAGAGSAAVAEPKSFWALKDVDFDIRRGEVVGIIGRNGAGKSTLLKILSRITDPTKGGADINGRVGSLLEVGTGFHPELTGRENVFLNGAILGMRRAEIVGKFDEIVAFAGTEKFLDMPVKHYSSGMYTRLAFAVAAHLDPEILIVDEVLAVGDLEFQRKCMGKMGEVARQGRTVLFVSHNLPAIRALCTSAVLLAAGQVERIGSVPDVIDQYLFRSGGPAAGPIEFRATVPGLGLTDAYFVHRATGKRTDQLTFGDDYDLRLELTPAASPVRGAAAVTILDAEGVKISMLAMIEEGLDFVDLSRTTGVRFGVPDLAIIPGSYRLWVDVGDQHVNLLTAESAGDFTIEPRVMPGAAWPYGRGHGVCRVARGASVESVESVESTGPGGDA